MLTAIASMLLTMRSQKSQTSMRMECRKGNMCVALRIKMDLRTDWQVVVTSWMAAHGLRS